MKILYALIALGGITGGTLLGLHVSNPSGAEPAAIPPGTVSCPVNFTCWIDTNGEMIIALPPMPVLK